MCGGGGGMELWSSDRETPAAMSLYKLLFKMTTFYIAFYESYLSTKQTEGWAICIRNCISSFDMQDMQEGGGLIPCIFIQVACRERVY